MEENKNKPASDEIDIREFLMSIRDGLVRFFSWLLNTVLLILIFLRNFLFARFKVLVLGGVIGGLLGLAYFTLQSPSYETDVTLRSNYLKGLYFNTEVEKLDKYCKNQSYDLLSAALNIPEEELQFVNGFESQNVNNYYDIYQFYTSIENMDSVILNNELGSSLFVITAKVNVENEEETLDLSKLEKGLIHYFKNNAYINKLYSADLNRLKSRKQKLETELANLDSLKSIIKEKLSKEEVTNTSLNISFSEDKNDGVVDNPLSIFAQDYNFFRELQEVNSSLELLEEVQVVNGFTGVKSNKKVFLAKSVVYGGFYGGIATIIIFLLIAFNAFLNSVEKKVTAEKV